MRPTLTKISSTSVGTKYRMTMSAIPSKEGEEVVAKVLQHRVGRASRPEDT